MAELLGSKSRRVSMGCASVKYLVKAFSKGLTVLIMSISVRGLFGSGQMWLDGHGHSFLHFKFWASRSSSRMAFNSCPLIRCLLLSNLMPVRSEVCTRESVR